MPVSTSCKSFCSLCSLFVGVILFFACLMVSSPTSGQTELAGVYGRVTDQSGAVIVDAEVEIKNVETNQSTTVKTNQDGLYTIPSLHPGHYLISARKPGFKTVTVTQLDLNVQDNVVRNFSLQVGSIAETVTITADSLNLNTTDASVSTVVDRQFAENLPLNGRSFQTLIDLTPGVVVTPSNGLDNGQFSVNGQRTASNYWMVDGVSANIGVSSAGGTYTGNGPAGAVASFSVLGGTNSLVSVDAMQEFRIQTSTYAPEFGRTPGAQVSIATRSGTNPFHGTAFDYLRNGNLDANDWFANRLGLAKPQERQNDFGGTFSGPVIKNKTFFFFSYEGLRLRVPQTTLTTVPDLNARQNALPAEQPFLNAFPKPNGSDDQATGIAQFNATYSNPASLDAYSLRIDHNLTHSWVIFGRYSYSPSTSAARGSLGSALSVVEPTSITTQTGTVGATWAASSQVANDIRFNYSRVMSDSTLHLDNFGGATPLSSLPFPNGFSSSNGNFFYLILFLQSGQLFDGQLTHASQRQVNVVDSLSVQKGSHALKFGVDFRRLSPLRAQVPYALLALFTTVASAGAGTPFVSQTQNNASTTLLFRNLGLYAQDTWHVVPRVTLTYGLRWDVDFVPQTVNGPNYLALANVNINNLSTATLAPTKQEPYGTRYDGVAPRIGIAYQLSQRQNWGSVLRGGFGVFYDLASTQAGPTFGYYPFGASVNTFGGTFPAPTPLPQPPITPASLRTSGLLTFDPNLRQPYSLEWNVAAEQALGSQQGVSISYVGALGRRLLQTAMVTQPNPHFGQLTLITNAATSDYDAFEVQFRRRMSHGLQALASYTWSHSLDDASAGSPALVSNNFVPSAISANRGPSDFDIRDSFSAGLTYDIPAPKVNKLTNTIVRGWAIESFVLARSAPPVDVIDKNFVTFNGGFSAATRPDLVGGQPLYLFGSAYPGGKAFNPAAFTDPPRDPNTGNPVRQGTVSRNALRGFGATQWDFAVHRDFPIRESLHLQFRAEMFNVLNHPNFGSPSGSFGQSGFGLSNQMFGQSLNNQNLGGGAFSPLYQIGGPRSIQLALKLFF